MTIIYVNRFVSPRGIEWYPFYMYPIYWIDFTGKDLEIRV